VYYDPKTGYGGVQALYRQVRKHQITLAQVREWVKEQDTYTLHKPIRRKFKRHRTKVTDIDEQWQLDLADVSKLKKDNDGYTFLLCAIDVLSKYAWVVPIYQKTGKEMIRALQQIFKDRRCPVRIQWDQGKEFTNRELRQAFKSFHFFTTRNAETKASMWNAFSGHSKHACGGILPNRRPDVTWMSYPTWCTATITRIIVVFEGLLHKSMLRTSSKSGRPCMGNPRPLR
jgi:transposase InsO family protein